MRRITAEQSQWRAQRCRGKNLLNPRDAISTTISGVTFAVQPDFSIKLTGTSTNTIYYDLNNADTWSPGTYYISGGLNSNIRVYATVEYATHTGGAAREWRCGGGSRQIRILIDPGTVCDGVVRPMITTESTTDYEPYCGSSERIEVARGKGGYFSVLPEFGLRVMGRTAQDGVSIRCVKAGSKIRCCGANLLPKGEPIVVSGNGVTFTLYDDGRIHVEGTSTAITYFIIDGGYKSGKHKPENLTPGEVYVFSSVSTDPAIEHQMIFYDTSTGDVIFNHQYHGSFRIPTEFEAYGAFIRIMSGKTVNGDLYPMVNDGGKKLPYEPYVKSEITVPCDLYEGDAWYPMTGEVRRWDGNDEQYDPQRIFAPQGRVTVVQEPTELMADLSATMLVRR